MARYTNEQKRQARVADLYSFLLDNHPEDFNVEGDSITMADNPSLSIKSGFPGFNDFSPNPRGRKSGNPIDFLTEYMGYSMVDAILSLCGYATEPVITTESAPIKRKSPKIRHDGSDIVLPEPDTGRFSNLFAFLQGRNIPANFIQALIDQHLLYQSTHIDAYGHEHKNAVFVNKARDFAEIRGTYTYGPKQYHGIAKRSRYDGFWFFGSGKSPQKAYICEAAIDAISLCLLNGREERAYYISIAGAGKQETINRIKTLIPSIIAVDNDDAGEACRANNHDLPHIIPVHKDWNEDLTDCFRTKDGQKPH